MYLEEATRNFFIQCIKDPAILNEIKKAVFNIDEFCSSNRLENIQNNSSFNTTYSSVVALLLPPLPPGIGFSGSSIGFTAVPSNKK